MKTSRLREYLVRLNGRLSRRRGVQPTAGDAPLVVSLTTIPSRYDRVSLALLSILSQSLRPDRVILWVGEGPSGEMPDLPPSLTKLQGRGLEIRARVDLGPHTKLVHALRECPACVIVTADDDILYPRRWLQGLYASFLNDPGCVHCHRAHEMRPDGRGGLLPYREWEECSPGKTGPSMWLFPTGTGGVLYPVGALHDEVCNVDAFRELCPTADDTWFKAMALLNKVPCKKVRPYSRKFPMIRGTQESRLWTQNRTSNDAQIRAVFERYRLFSVLENA